MCHLDGELLDIVDGLGEVSLADALARSGFVQAPIRFARPARAQDLILRQRVQGCRVVDLEASYEALDLEEDFLYAYCYLTRETWRHLHPRRKITLKALERRVLDVVIDMGGLLRVSRRERGVRVYKPPIDNIAITRPEAARIQQVVLLVARILAPVPERSLVQTLGMLGHYCHLPPGKSRPAIGDLVKRGQLVSEEVDGAPYLWPSNLFDARTPESPERVRILAPFDPLVWDRRRFEHLWG